MDKRDINDEYKLYSAPSLPGMAAYISMAIAIFFASYMIYAEKRIGRLEDELHTMRKNVTSQLIEIAARDAVQPRQARTTATIGRKAQKAAPRKKDNAAVASAPKTQKQQRTPAQKPEKVATTKQSASETIVIARVPQKEQKPATVQKSVTKKPEKNVTVTPATNAGKTADTDLRALAPGGKKTTIKKSREAFAEARSQQPPAKTAEPTKTATPATTKTPTKTIQAVTATASKTPAQKNPQPANPVKSQAGNPAAGQGMILATNPQQQRVMISTGASRGLEAGNRFSIWRRGNYVGDVRVTSVYRDMSVCEIVTPTPRGIRVGDTIKLVSN